MNTSIVVVLAAVCAFACLSVNAEHDEKCKDEMMKIKKEMNAMLEDESAPACANELDECMKQLGKAAVEKLGDEIPAECKEKMENFAKRMEEKHKEE